jgi:choline dehydrogenase
LVANRLSEDPRNRVLLLEAGGRDLNPLIRILLMAGFMSRSRMSNWHLHTEPEAHLDGRRVFVPCGKTLGGSSALNGMIYIRGHQRDYDLWQQSGCEGWGYDDVLPYFRRSERNLDRSGDPYHGDAGNLRVGRERLKLPLIDAFIAAGRSAGYRLAADFNGAEQEGFGLSDFTIDRGRRQSTAVAFLHPVRSRRNLNVITRAHAARVLLEGRRAIGLEYLHGGQRQQAKATREVILCAGAIHSPVLLQLSGIGRPDDLAAIGVSAVVELPAVGHNLMDHISANVLHRSLQPATLSPLLRPWRALPAILQQALLGTGPAASFPMIGGFVSTRPELEMPDIQYHFVPGLYRAPGVEKGAHGFTLVTTLLRPESRGSVRARSSDPLDAPAIHGNFLATPTDIGTLREGVRVARRVIAQLDFDPWRGEEVAPGRQVEAADDLDRWLRATAATIFHPMGTCRMGHGPNAVVDPRLRVHGVDGLRVADASVIPLPVGGNTNAPTIMIAERAADMILGRAPLPRAEIARTGSEDVR